jgi:alanine racemase
MGLEVLDDAGRRKLRTSAYIDLDAIEENYRSIGALVEPGVTLLPVIKADAYGHGAARVALRLQSIGAGYLAVASIDEAIELRKSGVSCPILVLSGVMPWEDVRIFVENDVTPTVVSFESLERAAAHQGPKPLKIHVKVDTGMGRLGFSPGDLGMLLERLGRMGHIHVEGLMSHFASSELRDDYGEGQVEAFRGAIESFKASGLRPRFVHMANSAAICDYPEAHFTMVRPGIMLYGSYPDKSLRGKVRLKPVMRWTSSVGFVRTVPAKSSLSYGRTCVTERETRVAYVPIGYADGFPRSLSNRGTVLIKGRRCRIMGTVCMEWVLADVTGVADVGPGEEVVIMGTSGVERITADEIADQAGTIPYEILCGVSRRVPRLYG